MIKTTPPAITFRRWKRRSLNGLFFVALACCTLPATAQVFSPKEIKKLSIEDLMNMEVTLVSRSPQRLTEAASAIQVITNDDIRRSGATNIPEALRLAPNLQVSQLNASTWLVSARGFTNVFTNKLLVMIDGRSVYTPLYGGVLWEQQNLLLEDVDRIEVVSGPGGSLWGANAVNGVINIITKSSKETTGLFATAGMGDFLHNRFGLRYGAAINDKLSFRISGQHAERNSTTLPNGSDAPDSWMMNDAALRMDWDASDKDAVVLQAGLYDGTRYNASPSPENGQHLLTRWTHTLNEKSDLSLQLYYDRYFREDAGTNSYDKMKTADLDFQHRLPIGKKQSFTYGLGYRRVKDDAFFTNTAGAGIVPRFKDLDQFSGFVQDEINITDNWHLTLGTKLLHNVYTGWEYQPSGRISLVKPSSTLWAAISRAVRTPSRFDVDYYLPMVTPPPPAFSVAGGPNFISEKIIAYEAGYRLQPTAKASLSLAGFYNIFHDIYSVEPLPNTNTYQIQNGSEGKSWGAELAASWQVSKAWQLRGGYSYFDKDLHAKPGHNFDPTYLGNDVRNRALLQSMLDLPLNLELDLVGRYYDGLGKTFGTAAVPGYFTFDARLAWTFSGFELALVGQNLAQDKHTEFGSLAIPRNYFAKLSARF